MSLNILGIFNKKPKKYYREWLTCHGWGVMMGYDSVWATSVKEAAKDEPADAYTCIEYAERNYLGYYECVIKIEDEHLDLTDEELSKIYGSK